MKNIFKLIGIITIALVIGLSTACSGGDDGTTPGTTPDTTPVTTNVPVTGVTLNKSSISLTVGSTANLTATVTPDNATNKALTWSTSDAAKATVSNGLVTAVAEGTATITVTTADGNKTDTCTVTVTPAGSSIAVLDHITAVYAGVEVIFPDTTLHTLKDDLTVKAHYSDNTETTLEMEDYELSGTLTVGSSVITVSYQSKTTTFTVTVHTPHVHIWSGWTQSKAPTYTEPGEEERHCTADPPHSETRSIPQIPFTTIADFRTWLSSQPANNASTPYTVKLNVSNLGGARATAGSVGNALYTYRSNIYVYLDFSDSNFTSIPNNAFQLCTNLTGIIIPNSVTTSIGTGAFDGCTSLSIIDVDAGNNAYSSQNGLLYNKDKTILIRYPEGKTGSTFTIPNGVISIGDGAFFDCPSLTSVTIPDSITSIGNGAFAGCTSLTTINVDAGNSTYSSQDGVLYNKAKTVLIQYLAGRTGSTFTIPNSVTGIQGNAFDGCTSLTSVIIPDSVTSIGYGVFWGCTNLTSITFATGSNISSANFGDNAFPQGSNGSGGNTLKTAYNAASPKEGTYTRAANGSTWSKQ